jgi:hypothetical protein
VVAVGATTAEVMIARGLTAAGMTEEATSVETAATAAVVAAAVADTKTMHEANTAHEAASTATETAPRHHARASTPTAARLGAS